MDTPINCFTHTGKWIPYIRKCLGAIPAFWKELKGTRIWILNSFSRRPQRILSGHRTYTSLPSAWSQKWLQNHLFSLQCANSICQLAWAGEQWQDMAVTWRAAAALSSEEAQVGRGSLMVCTRKSLPPAHMDVYSASTHLGQGFGHHPLCTSLQLPGELRWGMLNCTAKYVLQKQM